MTMNARNTETAAGHVDTRKPSLVALRDLKDFNLPANWPDIRGWNVVSLEGTSVGTVDRLLLDPHVKRLR